MDGPELAGRLFGFLIVLAIPIVMIVIGRRRQAETSGEKGKALSICGIVLLVLVVLSILAQAGQVAQA